MDNNITVQTTSNIWENVFLKSQGSYFQYIIYKLGKFSDSVITNDEAKDLLKIIRIEKKNFSKKAIETKPIKTEEIPFELPKNWIWCRLGDITNYGSSEKEEPKNMDSDTWVLDLEDIEKQTSKLLVKVRFSVRQSQSTKSKFKNGDVLYSKLRPYLDKVIVADEDGVCTSEILPLKCFGNLNPEYLKIALKSAYFLNYVNNQVKGMKMPRLETKAGQMALIPLPPLSEQKIIVEFLNKFKLNTLETEQQYFNAEIEKDVIALHLKQLRNITLQTELKTQSNLLSKLRQAYLQEAVMGKLSEPRLAGFKDDGIISDDKILQSYNLENHGSDKLTDDKILDEKILSSFNPSGATFRNHSPDKETGKALLAQIKAQKAELIKQGKLRKEKPLPPIKPEEIPFKIPDNWVWCRLGDLALHSDYGTSQKADLNSSDVPVLRMGNIQEGALSFESLKYVKSNIDDLPKLYLKNGDFLFNRTNSFELVGKSAIFKESDDTFTFASYLIRVRFWDITVTEYITFWINSRVCRKTQIEPNTIQQNGQANFNGTKLKDVLVPLPPLSEQKAIVEKVEGLLATVSLLEEENKIQQKEVQRLMGAVLQEAFGGSI